VVGATVSNGVGNGFYVGFVPPAGVFDVDHNVPPDNGSISLDGITFRAVP
jgi:hypothetical protein